MVHILKSFLLVFVVGLCFALSCNLAKVDEPIANCVGSKAVSAAFEPDKLSCVVPCSISFTNQSEGANSYHWDFGNGQTSSSQSPNPVSFNTTGDFKVTLIASNNHGCADTTELTVSIISPQVFPTASFVIINNGCDAPCGVQFQNTSLNAVSYQWDFGNGGNSVAVSPSQTYASKGIYNVTLIATAANGLKDTVTQAVTIVKLPVADFTFSNNNCVAPCAVAFTENSQFETSYIWNFGDGSPISTLASPVHTYANKGTYDVRLIAVNPDGADTITRQVTILSPYFKSVIDVNAADVSPLLGVERSDGQFHVLFLQNSVHKSVLVSPSKVVGNVASYNFTFLSDLNEIMDSGQGGFAMVGSNGGSTRAILTKIGSTQVKSFEREISFTGNSQLSQGQGVMLNASDQFVVTGSYIPTGGGDMFPGFSFVSQAGTLSTNTFVNTPAASLGALYGEGIAQLTNGNYVLIVNQWTFGGSPSRYLVRATSSGTYAANRNLGSSSTIQLYQIFGVDNNVFVWQTNSNVHNIAKYDGSLNPQGSIALSNTTVTKILKAADGNIIVCGVKNGSAWLAKYNSSTMSSTPIWERNYTETSGTTGGIAVARLVDGGYLLTGLHTSTTNQKRLYLVKTDSQGNAE